GLRHDEESRFDWGITEAELIKQRQEKWHTADTKTGDEAPTHGCAKGAESEKREPEQRKGGVLRMQPVAGKKGEGDCEQAEDFADAEGVVAEHFEHIGEQGYSGAEKDEA